MRKLSLTLIFFFVCVTVSAVRIGSIHPEKKCSPEIRRFMKLYEEQGQTAASKSFNLNSNTTLVPIAVFCADYERTARKLNAMDINYCRVARSILTAKVRPSDVYAIAGLDAVSKVSGLDKRRLFLDQARSMSKVDAVQNGESLETPFTGKGVTIGVIDLGFLYKHPAFRVTDDSTRITGVWNLAKEEEPHTSSAEILRYGEDYVSEAHGTHVAGIAAGGKVGSSTYYGMAPDAHVVMVSSYDFSTYDVVSGVSFIKKMAEKYNEPWVVNMSFGTNMCIHDGTDDLDQALDSIASEGSGVFVASAGNQGADTLHAYYNFTVSHDTCLVVVQRTVDTDQLNVVIAGTDSTSFTAKPVYLNTSNGTYIVPTKKELQRKNNIFDEGLEAGGNRYYYIAMMPIRRDMAGLGSVYQPAFLVRGKPGHGIHAFLNSDDYNSFTTTKKNECAAADALISIASPAGARSVVAVGAYVSKMKWPSVDGHQYGFSVADSQPSGTLAYFSSVGPMLDSTLLKPTVCAPGFGIVSSIKEVGEYKNTNDLTVEKTTYSGANYFYGVMQGTSQSSPVVAGVVALWLQANPGLTYKEVTDIIRRSSTNDTHTGPTWNISWGYGKINAYEGIKLALQKATGIYRNVKSEMPVTVQKGPTEWKLLFNSDEPSVQIQLYCVEGRCVMQRKLAGVRAGDEELIMMNEYPPGIYILKIQTSNSTSSRKVYVR